MASARERNARLSLLAKSGTPYAALIARAHESRIAFVTTRNFIAFLARKPYATRERFAAEAFDVS